MTKDEKGTLAKPMMALWKIKTPISILNTTQGKEIV